MQEIIEQIVDYLKGIWLKRRFIIISTWLICPFAWVFISQLDNVYESEARIYADTPVSYTHLTLPTTPYV